MDLQWKTEYPVILTCTHKYLNKHPPAMTCIWGEM